MTFNTEVVGCYWKQEKGEWLLKLKETKADGSTRLFEDTCNMLLHGTGILNNFKWPKIEGMEKFKGKILHTARWDQSYQKEDWAKDRVAVIGSGASSIQTVPNMQPHAKHLDVSPLHHTLLSLLSNPLTRPPPRSSSAPRSGSFKSPTTSAATTNTRPSRRPPTATRPSS